MTKATYQRHLQALEAGRIEKTNVIGLRKALNNDARRDAGLSHAASGLSGWEVLTLHDRIVENPPRVVGELHDSGVKLLRNKRYAKKFGQRERAVIDQLDHFELTGFYQFHRLYYVPCYRAVATDGSSFTFYNIPWQSGGSGPVIIN